MRLINTTTYDFEEFIGSLFPQYAILSHTWREDELTFSIWADSQRRVDYACAQGYAKIWEACKVAAEYSLDYIWIDTVCINKESSAELSEAINSMFAWYQRAEICFAWLDDFTGPERLHPASFARARWFSRGWTLQELLAPETVIFLDANWVSIGTKKKLSRTLSTVTGIEDSYLNEPKSIFTAPVARRMSWAANRTTSREEDMAYCLLGIFQINMPLLYGEGKRAFVRLQEEIIAHSNDHSIFCWSWHAECGLSEYPEWYGCLAPSPSTFRGSKDFEEDRYQARISAREEPDHANYQLTNNGLRINLLVLECMQPDFKLIVFNVKDTQCHKPSLLAICVQPSQGPWHLARSRFPNSLMRIPAEWVDGQNPRKMYLYHQRDPGGRYDGRGEIIQHLRVPPLNLSKYGVIPVYSATYTRFLWGERGRISIWPASTTMDPPGIWGPVHLLRVTKETKEEVIARGRAFELTNSIPSVQLPFQMHWECHRWTVRTDLKFKPRASKDPPETRWNVADLWKLRLDMSISEDFEFELDASGDTPNVAVRPVMLSPYEQDLYPFDIREASNINKSRAVPVGKMTRALDELSLRGIKRNVEVANRLTYNESSGESGGDAETGSPAGA
ncbi:heterokaryon incompatibility protein-domain-containing protein [Immersiella caudata]|uniref:Heterokaryon incompatibility protein-domain-containing protein n=1 Tax=Immersiella caudata TaxID=314043 RepID=A0AA39XE52_9PEZI|nr:heterokaryon incompatibility protein-domain-containing protein [Immersiella caudata]